MSQLINEGTSRAGKSLVARARAHQSDIVAPKTDDELWEAVKYYLNIEIPRTHVCEGTDRFCNCSPFQAFADAYFARNGPIHVWHASRGFGGKSFMLATLTQAEAIFMGAKANLLGGSGEQATRVLNYMYGEEVPDVLWDAPNAPRNLVSGGYEAGSLKRQTMLDNGGYIRALMASTRSVRGPHPERLRLDEIDEMDLVIFDAAMGQTMALRDIPAHTVCSSTWHYSDGTMTEILERAKDNGWPVYRWCYMENLTSNGGWLPDSEVERKKQEVPKVMFEVEYDLSEPNPGDRAIDPDAVKDMFKKELGEYTGKEHRVNIEVEKPEHGFVYLSGTDWAKRSDWTIQVILKELAKYDEDAPEGHVRLRLVLFSKGGRKPWPVLVGNMEKNLAVFGEETDIYSAHDETGIGDVIGDYMAENVESTGLWMAGRLRHTILSDYISAVEHGYIECPDIEWMRREHELASNDDVFGTGHLPDSIQAMALAYYMYKNRPKKKKVRATWGS